MVPRGSHDNAVYVSGTGAVLASSARCASANGGDDSDCVQHAGCAVPQGERGYLYGLRVLEVVRSLPLWLQHSHHGASVRVSDVHSLCVTETRYLHGVVRRLCDRKRGLSTRRSQFDHGSWVGGDSGG